MRKMMFLSFALLVLNLFPLANPAEAFQRFQSESKHEKEGLLQVYKMTVSPAKAPRPMLKYRLRVPLVDQLPGNAAQLYLRSTLERNLETISSPLKRDQQDADYTVFCDGGKSFDELPAKALNKFKTRCDMSIKNYLRPASRRSNCDWGIHASDIVNADFLETPLSFAQSTREIARLLTIRARLAISEKDFDKAIETLRIQNEMSADVAESPFLVSQLVGYACDGISHIPKLELITTKTSPNLYFALLDEQRYSKSLRNAMQLESQWILGIDPIFKDIETKKLSDRQWNKKYGEVFQKFQKSIFSLAFDSKPDVDGLSPIAIGMGAIAGAKDRLEQAGYAKDEIDKMPNGKIMLLDFSIDIQHYMHRNEVISKLPYIQSKKMHRELEKSLQKDAKTLRPAATVALVILPALDAVRNAERRTEWLKGSLKVIESLRLHAAENGKFPEKLSDLKWPIPSNPFNQKPYQYRLENGTAIIELPHGTAKGIAYRYEIKLDKEN